MSVISGTNREQVGPSAPPPGPPAAIPSAAGASRIVGVDVARGLALLGMIAVHIFDSLHSNNTPSFTFSVMGGHSLATFVLLAGVSLTFITRRGPTNSRWTDAPTAAALATRALLVTLIGLVLNSALDPDIEVILPYYGVMFLLAIPLLRLRSRVLVWIAIGLVVLAPLLVLAGFGTQLPDHEPTLGALLHPLAAMKQFLITGSYPVVAYMAFICIGMVIGRLDLSRRAVAVRLTVVGIVLAAGSWFLSTLILFRFGGLAHLRAAAPANVSALEAQNIILWEPEPVLSWWWLVERAPYTTTPFRMLHDLGVAMAWLGISLLITRLRLGRWTLRSVAAAGAMSLTLYTAHVVVLSSDFMADYPIALFTVLACVALTFAVLWRRDGRRGPLEAVVASAAGRARHLVAGDPAGPRKGD